MTVVVQFTDTHVVAPGRTHFGTDTARYLADAITAVNALRPRPICVVVTGDLVDHGEPEEYANFARIMAPLAMPYYVLVGNHDRRDRLRETLPPETFGHAHGETVRYHIDAGPLRFVGLDANLRRPSAGAALDGDALDWLEATLDADPDRPTIVGVHQPPFRTGLHYLDAFGFRGRARLREIVEARRNVGRVIGGHIHCHRSQQWAHAFACTAPSCAPQKIPLLFMEGTILGLRSERPGFATHAWDREFGFRTTLLRRDDEGVYLPEMRLDDAPP